MSSSIDTEAVAVIPRTHNEYGPSDTSDSASDAVGTHAELSDSDSHSTGEQSSVESVVNAPSQTENDLVPDISLDKIVRSGGEIPQQDGGDDTDAEPELDVRDDEEADDETLDDLDTAD